MPAGTRLVVELRDSVSTRGTGEGRSVTAAVVRRVDASGGTAVPRGALLYFTPVRLEPSGTAWQSAVVRVRFDSLVVGGASRPVQATLVRWHSDRSSRIGTLLSIALMLAAAGAGGLAGRWLVGARGILTGAALAAVAAAVYLTLFQPVDTVLPAGSQMEVRLESEVEVPAPQ